MTMPEKIAPQSQDAADLIPRDGRVPAEPEKRRIASPLSLLARRLRASVETTGAGAPPAAAVVAPEVSAAADPALADPAPAETPAAAPEAVPASMAGEAGLPAPEVEPSIEKAAETAMPEARPLEVPPRRAARVKTTFLGFEHSDGRIDDFFAKEQNAAGPKPSLFPVGWLVVVAGPGRGNWFALATGVSQIGRGDDQAVQLDFGDNAISRSNHAAIAYDDEENKFYIGHGGKTNIVRLNGRPVLSTEMLAAGDHIRMGETTLKFVPLCGAEFQWNAPID